VSKSKPIKTKKIVITGGHAGSTSYATIEELRKNHQLNWDIYFIGSKNAMEGRSVKTLESEVFPKIGVKYYPITTGRLQRNFTLFTLPSLIKIPIGFLNAFFLIAKIKPDITLSFGGFAAFPVVVLSYILGIPVIIHEQTVEVGRTNKYSKFFAKKIAVSRPESLKYFPKEKIVVTGNPISKEIENVLPKKKIGNPVTIFITGGSRGSTTLNYIVIQNLDYLLGNFKVIHQTGTLDFERIKNIRNSLPDKLKRNYEIFGVIQPWDWYKFIEKADLIISRSGANIVSEIVATKRPSILIPIPFSYKNEQLNNARYAKNLGIAEIIEQKNLNSGNLMGTINKIANNWKSMINDMKDPMINDRYASEKLVNLILEFV
jgi:UDP-N-acetylglucosamine--N-acetylmuramyl-(pentapeptide) pyrophosphoryl-undecaprenol N-acetylglucosamine transferase